MESANNIENKMTYEKYDRLLKQITHTVWSVKLDEQEEDITFFDNIAFKYYLSTPDVHPDWLKFKIDEKYPVYSWIESELIDVQDENLYDMIGQVVELFPPIFETIKLRNADQIDRFDKFFQNFMKNIQTLFDDMIEQDKCIDTTYYTIVELTSWMLVYCSCFDPCIFYEVVKELNFHNSDKFQYFLFKEIDEESNILINMIFSNKELIDKLMLLLTRTQIWKLLTRGDNISLHYLTTNFENFNKLLPNEHDEDFQEIKPIIDNYKDDEGMNLMHIYLLNLIEEEQEELKHIEIELINKMKNFLHLKYTPDNRGILPVYCILQNSFELLVESQLVSIDDFYRIDKRYYPLIMISKDVLENEDILNKIIRNHIESIINSYIYWSSDIELTTLIKNNLIKYLQDCDEEVFTREIELYCFGETYPLLSYLGLLNCLNDLFDSKNGNFIKNIINEQPYLLPFRYFNTTQQKQTVFSHIPSCDNIVDYLIEHNKTEYLFKILHNGLYQTNNNVTEYILLANTILIDLIKLIRKLNKVEINNQENKLLLCMYNVILTNMADTLEEYRKEFTDYILPLFKNSIFYKLFIDRIVFFCKKTKSETILLSIKEYDNTYMSHVITSDKKWFYYLVKNNHIDLVSLILQDHVYNLNLYDSEFMIELFNSFKDVQYEKLYDLFLENGYFDNFRQHHIHVLNDVIIKVGMNDNITRLPNMNHDIFYETDLFERVVKLEDRLLINYALIHLPPIEYTRKFFKMYNLLEFKYDILKIFFEKGFLGSTSIDDYDETIIMLIKRDIQCVIIREVISKLDVDFPEFILTTKIIDYLILQHEVLEKSEEILDKFLVGNSKIRSHIQNNLQYYLQELINKAYYKTIKYLIRIKLITLEYIDSINTSECIMEFVNQYKLSDVISKLTPQKIDDLLTNYLAMIMYQILEHEDVNNFRELNLVERCQKAYYYIFLTKLLLKLDQPELIQSDYIHHLLTIQEVEFPQNDSKYIYHIIIDYVKICKQKNINIVLLDNIIEKYPQIILLTNNLTQINLIPIDRLIYYLKSDLITPEIQDTILSQTDNLDIMLENVMIESKFISENMTLINNLIKYNIDIYINFITHNICLDTYLYATDNNDDYIISQISQEYLSSELIKKFIDTIPIEKIAENNTKNRPKIVNFLSKSYLEHILYKKSSTILITKYNLGKYLIGSFAEFFTNIDFDSIIELGNFIDIVDEYNRNIFMILLDKFPSEIINYFETNKNVQKYLTHVDKDGNNFLFYIVKSHRQLIERTIKIYTNFNNSSLNYTNFNNETLLMYAIKHKSYVDIIIQNTQFEQNYVYHNSGSILSYCIQYGDSELFDKLMNWKYLAKNIINNTTCVIEVFDWKTSKFVTKQVSLITYAGIKNSDIFRKFKQICFWDMLYQYNPNSFQIFLEKFGDQVKFDMEFIVNNAVYQPYSWWIFANSKYFNSEQFDMIKNRYTLPPTLRIGHLDEISHFVQTTNEYESSLENKCKICMIGKVKIMYGCHKHFVCVSCAIGTTKCPWCRFDDINTIVRIFD